ncbi:MAG: hypothetical protein HY646_20320 [Acidobacteria bacterium]|nr:hypothetical protein [Acidobacteriota bacterium]
MIYLPEKGYCLWDTWLFPAEDGFHLFHLRHVSGGPFSSIGHAVSTDLVHWTTLPAIAVAEPLPAWDAGPTLTGMVVDTTQSGRPSPARYAMFYGSMSADIERIGVMFSDDLLQWRKHPGNPILSPAGPHYAATPAESCLDYADFRDPCIHWSATDQCYHGFCCARLPGRTEPGSCLAQMRSRDSLQWELLPPVFVTDRYGNTEVPDYFEWNGRHYLLWNTTGNCGMRLQTPSRERVGGAFYAIASQWDGPYAEPADSLLLGAGFGRVDGYAGQTIPFEGGRLFYHQCVGDPSPAWGSPKKVVQHADGALSLAYWSGLEQLETGVVRQGFGPSVVSGGTKIGPAVWRSDGHHLSGRCRLLASAFFLPESVADGHVTCTVTLDATSLGALIVRWNGRHGVALILDGPNQAVEIGLAAREPGTGLRLGTLDRCRLPLKINRPIHVRMLFREQFFDAYVDDRWVFSTTLRDCPAPGQVGFAVERGQASFADLRIAAIEPLKPGQQMEVRQPIVTYRPEPELVVER